MAKVDSGAAPISEESIGYLQEAKKGKPRKFAMICKGTSVVSLVVYKKGNVEKHKKEAKQSGKGQFYFGFVDGKGVDIRFVLARSDGFESSPVKTSVMKSFLEDSADLKCKPYFEIVDAPQIVLDEDDPLVARFLKVQSLAFAARETYADQAVAISNLCGQIGGYLNEDQPEPATLKLEELEALLAGLTSTSSVAPGEHSQASTDDAAKEARLLEAMAKIQPLLEKALASNANRKSDLVDTELHIRELTQSGQFVQAQAELVVFVKLLQSLAVALPSADPTSNQDSEQDLGVLFNQRLKALLPQIKSVTDSVAVENARAKVGESAEFAKQKQFEMANELLDQAIEIVEQATDAARSKQTWEQSLARIEPAYQKALKGDPPDASKMRVIMNFATEQAAAGQYEKAQTALVRLEPLLASASSTPKVAPVSLVSLQQSRLAWDETRKRIQTGLKKLGDSIIEAVKEHNLDESSMIEFDLTEVADGAKSLNRILDNLDEKLIDKLDEALNATNNEARSAFYIEAKQIITEYQKFVASDPLMSVIDNNPFLPASIRQDVDATLKSLASKF